MRMILARFRALTAVRDRRRAVALRTLACAPLLFAVSACGDISRLVTPGKKGPAGPGMIAFTASVPRRVSIATDVVTLSVTASYLRQDGTKVRIGSQLLTLTSEVLQSVPIPVDVGTCLADATRDVGGATPANTASACAVILELALVVNGTVVDQQTVGPLRLSPGATTTVTEPVTLIDVASIVLLQPSGSVLAQTDVVQAIVGTSVALSAKVLDTRGGVVTDRPVTWISDAPAVATVDATSGVIRAVSVGTARIIAQTGNITSTANLRVLRAPAALTIAAGPGGGVGTIRSSPTGIDCKSTGRTLSGTCTFVFPGDAVVSLTSTADPGSVFSAWGDACTGASIGPSCQLTMSLAQTASARFTAFRRIVVTATSGSDGRGRVSGASGLDCRMASGAISGTCLVDVLEGTPYQLTAVGDAAGSGSPLQVFAGWGADCASASGAVCTVTPGSTNAAVTARFAGAQSISVSLAGNGGGLVTGGATIACTRANGANTGNCGESATYGSSVTLTAVPDAQSVFSGWTGACSGQSPSCTTSLTQARSVDATFAKRQVSVTMTLSGTGAGEVSLNGIVTCRTSGNAATTCVETFDFGTTVTVSGKAGSASLFNGFAGACAGVGPCTMIVTEPQTLAATFTMSQYPLTITLSGNGAGTVRASSGLVCASSLTSTTATCSALVAAGSTVTVNVSPTVESTFSGLSGDCSGLGQCAFVMDGARSVSAVFTRRQVQLLLQLSGTGGGTVSGDGVPFCTMALAAKVATCTRQVDYGGTIVFAGTPGPESTFDLFGGDCTGGTACTLTVVSPATVAAVFKRRQVPLTLTVTGTGAGSISVDGTSACALALSQSMVTCTRIVDVGAVLEIVGAAPASSIYNGLSGDCTGTAKCSLLVTAAHTVSAGFTRKKVPLTMTLTGLGGGNITIDGVPFCTLAVAQGSTTCSRQLDYGATYVFAGAPTIESVFDTFGGDCSAGTSCTISPIATAAVTGSFSRKPLPLTLTLTGTGGGAVSVNGVVACSLLLGQGSTTCTQMIPYGAAVTITGTATVESSHDGFGGDCSGFTCSVTLTAARAVTAGFTQRQAPLTLVLTGSGGGVLTVDGTAACTLNVGSATATCTKLVDLGKTVIVIAIPDGASVFGGYTNGCTSAAGDLRCPVTVTGPRTFGAVFQLRGTTIGPVQGAARATKKPPL